MRAAASVAALLVALSAFGQAPNPDRVGAIWDAASERMSRQVDVWFDDGDYPAVIQLLTLENDLFPHDYEVATNLGWMQENIEAWSDAETTYRRYHDQNPNDPDRSLPLAQFWFMRKQYAKLPEILESVVKNPKAHPNNFRILAHAYERLNRLQDSQRVWKQYIALVPSDGAAKANLKRVQSKLAKGG